MSERQKIIAQAMQPLSFLAGATDARVEQVAMKPKRQVTPYTAGTSSMLESYGIVSMNDADDARK